MTSLEKESVCYEKKIPLQNLFECWFLAATT